MVVVGCATPKGDWGKAEKVNTVNSYHEFLRKHSKSDFAAEATLRIEELDWEEAQRINNGRSYQDFLSQHPQGEFEKQAKQKIEMLSWEKVRKEQTDLAYENFLLKFSDSKYAPMAYEAIIKRHIDNYVKTPVSIPREKGATIGFIFKTLTGNVRFDHFWYDPNQRRSGHQAAPPSHDNGALQVIGDNLPPIYLSTPLFLENQFTYSESGTIIDMKQYLSPLPFIPSVSNMYISKEGKAWIILNNKLYLFYNGYWYTKH